MWRYVAIAIVGIAAQWLATSWHKIYEHPDLHEAVFGQVFRNAADKQSGARPPAPPETADAAAAAAAAAEKKRDPSSSGIEKSLRLGDVQADQVRRETAVPLQPTSREMRCGEPLGPSSVATTRGIHQWVDLSVY